MGFPINGGTPKLLVYFMENPTKIDDFRGTPIYRNPHVDNSPIKTSLYNVSPSAMYNGTPTTTFL